MNFHAEAFATRRGVAARAIASLPRPAPDSEGAPFVVVEGPDGVGKTSVARLLASGLNAESLRTPAEDLRPVLGEAERILAASPLARRLLYAASVVLASDRARANRRAGRATVCDRYWLSTRAWAEAEEEPPPPDDLGLHLLVPTLTVFLSAPLEVRAERLGRRGPLEAHDLSTLDRDFEQRLVAAYFREAERWCAGRFWVLDVARRSPEEAAAAVLARVAR